MEELEQTQQHERPWQGEERRSGTQGEYTGEERRKAAEQPEKRADAEKSQDV